MYSVIDLPVAESLMSHLSQSTLVHMWRLKDTHLHTQTHTRVQESRIMAMEPWAVIDRHRVKNKSWQWGALKWFQDVSRRPAINQRYFGFRLEALFRFTRQFPKPLCCKALSHPTNLHSSVCDGCCFPQQIRETLVFIVLGKCLKYTNNQKKFGNVSTLGKTPQILATI